MNHNSEKKCAEICSCRSHAFCLSPWTAAQYGDFHRIKFLLNTNPFSLQKFDGYGYSPLHYAAQSNHIIIMKYLLESPVCIAVDGSECGATPLHRAAYAGHYNACKLLLQYGENVMAIDTSYNDKLTPIQKAYLQGHESVVQLLLPHMGDNYASAAFVNLKKKLFDIDPHECVVVSGREADFIQNEHRNRAEVKQKVETTDGTDLFLGRFCGLCNKRSISFAMSKNKLVCNNCKITNQKKRKET